jgi:hypothetical protein
MEEQAKDSIITYLIVDLFRLCLPVDYPYKLTFRLSYGFRRNILNKLLIVEFIRTHEPWNEATCLDARFNKLSLPTYLVNSLIKTTNYIVLITDESRQPKLAELELTSKHPYKYWRSLKPPNGYSGTKKFNLDYLGFTLNLHSFCSSEYLDFFNYLKQVEVSRNNNHKEFTTIVGLIAEFNLRSESATGQKYIQLANSFKEGLQSLEDASLIKNLFEIEDEAFLQAT